MTKQNNGGPAFPKSGVKDGYGKVVGENQGMYLRDYFAGQAISGVISRLEGYADSPSEIGELASMVSYAVADAMLAARDRP